MKLILKVSLLASLLPCVTSFASEPSCIPLNMLSQAAASGQIHDMIVATVENNIKTNLWYTNYYSTAVGAFLNKEMQWTPNYSWHDDYEVFCSYSGETTGTLQIVDLMYFKKIPPYLQPPPRASK